jgi:hypothetical protein
VDQLAPENIQLKDFSEYQVEVVVFERKLGSERDKTCPMYCDVKKSTAAMLQANDAFEAGTLRSETQRILG